MIHLQSRKNLCSQIKQDLITARPECFAQQNISKDIAVKSFYPSIQNRFAIFTQDERSKNSTLQCKKNFLQSHGGFTFIEIIVALALLSIMGTSLFLMQSTIFQKLTKSHNVVSNLLQIEKEMIDFKLALAQALQEKKSMAEVTIHQEKHNPDMKVDVVVKPIQESSKLYKQFSKNVFMIKAAITKDQQQNQWVSFLYVPPKPEEKEEKTPSAKTPTAKTPTAKGVA